MYQAKIHLYIFRVSLAKIYTRLTFILTFFQAANGKKKRQNINFHRTTLGISKERKNNGETVD